MKTAEEEEEAEAVAATVVRAVTAGRDIRMRCRDV